MCMQGKSISSVYVHGLKVRQFISSCASPENMSTLNADMSVAAHSHPDHASHAVGTCTAIADGRAVVVERNRRKVMQVPKPAGTLKFGRGRRCVLLAVLHTGTIAVTSVLTHEVVATHTCEGATDFFFDDTWLVVVDGALGGTAPPAKICCAANLHGDVVWVADTAALDHATIVAVRYTVVPHAAPVVTPSPGYERYKKTAMFGTPDTAAASRASRACANDANVLYY